MTHIQLLLKYFKLYYEDYDLLILGLNPKYIIFKFLNNHYETYDIYLYSIKEKKLYLEERLIEGNKCSEAFVGKIIFKSDNCRWNWWYDTSNNRDEKCFKILEKYVK